MIIHYNVYYNVYYVYLRRWEFLGHEITVLFRPLIAFRSSKGSVASVPRRYKTALPATGEVEKSDVLQNPTKTAKKKHDTMHDENLMRL